MTTVLDCIERIPKCLKGIRDSYPERAKNIADYLSESGIKKVRRLVFIASGSSYNSAHTAKLFIKNQCGIETDFKYPNLFVNYEADTELSREAGDTDSTVYVVISQGGETKLVYQALEKIKNADSAVYGDHRGCGSVHRKDGRFPPGYGMRTGGIHVPYHRIFHLSRRLLVVGTCRRRL